MYPASKTMFVYKFFAYFSSIALTLFIGLVLAVGLRQGTLSLAENFGLIKPASQLALVQALEPAGATTTSGQTLVTTLAGHRFWPVATDTVEIVLVGDIMLDRGVEQVIISAGHADYNFPFAKVPGLAQADIVFANLEGPLSDQGNDLGSLYSFRMATATAPALKQAGFSVLSLANNHSNDWSPRAFVDTLKQLKQNNLGVTGAGLNSAEARQALILERQNLKIAFLAFSDVGPAALAAGSKRPGILLADSATLPGLVRSAKKQSDFLIVAFHFGEEYVATSSPRQQKLAHLAIDSGADAVVGSHPHVIQELETYHGKPIAYSLGNFVFDQYFSAETMQGGVWRLLVGRQGLLDSHLETVYLNRYYQPEYR